MSGIYIKGMEMPTSPVLFCIHPDGKVFADLEGGWRQYKAVPVPEHGRLGDLEQAAVILERLRDHCGNEDMSFALNWAVNTIRGLTPIIPAEEVEG